MRRFVAGFSQNAGQTSAETGEKRSEERKSRATTSDCSCVRCLIFSRNSRVENFLSSNTQRALTTLNSSSPVVSLAEVKTRPRMVPAPAAGLPRPRNGRTGSLLKVSAQRSADPHLATKNSDIAAIRLRTN
ncbi:hypothetical protein K0M31_009732 [Melipona bicolor]|uniref:Uncharacterized protein n=1 Tax=Melipona bicolor TaxID=60889 RepID=A0AA40FND7_9HYME|nr:hypothetical protein K0M31_009732 [Melipona bicolor]